MRRKDYHKHIFNDVQEQPSGEAIIEFIVGIVVAIFCAFIFGQAILYITK